MNTQKIFWMLSGALFFTGAMCFSALAQSHPPSPPPTPPAATNAAPSPANPRPKNFYRVTYTLIESENGNRLGVQHEEMVASDDYSELKLGSHIPVPTMKDSSLYKYEDIGLNINAMVHWADNIEVIASNVEQSSLEDSQKSDASAPVIRQIRLRSTIPIVEGKTFVIGSLDLPGSNHHLQVELTATRVQ